MDTYTLSFTLPRSSIGHAVVAEEAAASARASGLSLGKSGLDPPLKSSIPHASASPATQPLNSPDVLQSQNQQHGQQPSPSQQPSQQPTPSSTSGVLGSMRSRFPPSVKLFTPNLFGSKRTNDRIAEAHEGEGPSPPPPPPSQTVEAPSAHRSSLEWKKARMKSSSSLPLTVPEEGTSRADAEQETVDNRDTRSLNNVRSSFEFGGSTSPVSLRQSIGAAPPGVIGAEPLRQHRHNPSQSNSSTHSVSASITHIGPRHPLTASELAEAAQRMAADIRNRTQCVVSCTLVPEEASAPASTPSTSTWPSVSTPGSSPFATFGGQLPFPSSYPYQQYASGFDQDGSAGPGFPSGLSGPISNPFSSSSTSLTSLNQPLPSSQAQTVPAPVNGTTASRKSPRYNFHLSGTFQQVMDARGMVMRDHPFRSRATVKLPKAEIIEDSPASSPMPGQDNLKASIRQRLDEIASSTDTHFAVMGKETKGADLGYGLETERSVELVISGQLTGVEFARIKTLVLLDELAGLSTLTCEIDQKFHNIIGGRKRNVIQTIQEQTSTSVYFPLPLSDNLCGQSLGDMANVVYITGDFFGAQRARDMVYQVFAHKSKSTISRDTAILPRKIDWMLSEHLEDLRQIMVDNGTFIGLPPLGNGQVSRVSVYGESRVNIERSIRSLMGLACQFYVASLWLLPPMAYNALVSTPALNLSPAQVTPVLQHVANSSGAEIVFKSNCFEIHGLETEAKNAVGMVLDLDIIKKFNCEVRFQIELAISEREFLQGRKCGKVNKIMKQCGVRIKFETFNDYNFLIELSSNDRASALQGLALLQEELPAEVSFHVPEAYHKRCIGVGGKQIQKVMKKYGVYVKFSNAEEFAALGGYIDNEDNVIARTPAKNAINLENLKQSVMEMVNPKDKDYMTESVTIARRHHRGLLGEKGIFIHDIESKCSSKIIFPPRETCSDLVSIFGPESQIHIASAMLLEHVPFEAEFRAPASIQLQQVLASQDFTALVERVKRDLNIHVVPVPAPQGASETVFKLRLSRSNSDFLPTAKDLLEDFLVSRNINVYSTSSRTRSDSFASSFPHFANKLISTPSADSAEPASRYQAELAARLGEDPARLRTAASSPALKALFDGPAGAASQRQPHHSHHSTASLALPHNGSSPLNGSSLYSSPFTDSMPGGVSSDVWSVPPRQPTLSNATIPGPGITFPMQDNKHHHVRPNENFAGLNNSSESYGPGPLDDRNVSTIRKPRSSYGYRAQSLDISQLGTAADAASYGNQLHGSAFYNGHNAQGINNTGPLTSGAAYAYGVGQSPGFGGPFGIPSQGPQPPRFVSHASSSSISRLQPSASSISLQHVPQQQSNHPSQQQAPGPQSQQGQWPSSLQFQTTQPSQPPVGTPGASQLDEVSRMLNAISFPRS